MEQEKKTLLTTILESLKKTYKYPAELFQSTLTLNLEERAEFTENYIRFIHRIARIVDTHPEKMKKLERLNEPQYLRLKYFQKISTILKK